MSPVEAPVLESLNPAQREAVTHSGGPLLVVAGPGSGKTRAIAHRIAWLVEHEHVPPARILGVTFTNKAARAMQERVTALTGLSPQSIWISTFHRACVRMLRAHGDRIGLPRNFLIYDTEDQERLLGGVLRDMLGAERAKQVKPNAILPIISWCKNHAVSPYALGVLLAEAEAGEEPGPYAHARARLQRIEGFDFEHLIIPAFLEYNKRLLAADAFDFDDLLLHAVRLLHETNEVRLQYAHRFLHVLVDEYQDTNHIQYELTRLLVSVHGNLTAVGILRNFEQDFPDARVVLLEQNYRSTQPILDVANALIRKSAAHRPRTLVTDRTSGDPPGRCAAANETDEARFVVATVRSLARAGRAYRDVAVLFRVNAQSQPLEQELVHAGIPYRLLRGLPFFERAEVKDLLAYLRLVVNPRDTIAFNRALNTPPRGIGEKSRKALEQWAQEEELPPGLALRQLSGGTAHPLPLSLARRRNRVQGFQQLLADLGSDAYTSSAEATLRAVVEATNFEAYLAASGPEVFEKSWEHVQQLIGAAAEYDQGPEARGVEGFLEEAALVADADHYDEQADAVTLSTLHAAKGLEFGVVFVVGLEEGTLPHYRSLDDADSLDEERRLLFVGVTRAKDCLFLTLAKGRFSWGWSWERREPSRFLKDIPAKLLTTTS